MSEDAGEWLFWLIHVVQMVKEMYHLVYCLLVILTQIDDPRAGFPEVIAASTVEEPAS